LVTLILRWPSIVANCAQNQHLRILGKGAQARLQFVDCIHVCHALIMPALGDAYAQPGGAAEGSIGRSNDFPFAPS
jgi:hypothetical protein